jgi:hypothetical protein
MKEVLVPKRDWRAWLFLCNPDRFLIFDDLVSLRRGTSWDWSMSQHWNNVAVGDPFGLWITGPMRGLYLLGTIKDKPEWSNARGNRYWASARDAAEERWFVPLRIEKRLITSPVTLQEVDQRPSLDRVAGTLRRPSRQPFGLTSKEWGSLEALANKR